MQERLGDMKTLVGLLVAMAMFLVLNGTSVSASEPIGKVVSASKTVRASGTAGTRVLEKNAAIFQLDRISTNATGTGEFQFNDGTKLAIGPGASLAVNQLVFKSKSRFQKLGLSAARGTFRWISGSSASSAYKVNTPHGTIGIRGTAFDVTIRSGRVYVALITGNAKFCTGSSCRTLKRSCDYIEVKGRNISEPQAISKGFKKRETARQIFPYLANPKRLSSRFRVGGANCFGKIAAFGETAIDPSVTEAAAGPEPGPEPGPAPEPAPPKGKCGGGNCGNGKGHGFGNGNGNEGHGNDP
jgi:FecR-like protein